MPGIDDKNDTEDDEMEQDTPENDESEEEDDSDSGSGSDDEDSSELDEGEIDRRRMECMYDMIDLERQFSLLRDQLYSERTSQLDEKLEEVREGKAHEYLNPLAQLQDDMRVRTQVAGILQELKVQNSRNRYDAEEQASEQHFHSEKELLFDSVKQDLEERIRRLEEDRHNIDISSDLWNESQASMKKSKKRGSMGISVGAGGDFGSDRRRKPVTVAGPYIVYMLRDMDIIDDWTAIKKAIKQAQRRKEMMKTEEHAFSARFDDGKLFYEGEWYSKGHHIIIDNREDSPVHASITAINTGEVWVKRSDGNKSKLYIAQLQKGKYTIRHVPY